MFGSQGEAHIKIIRCEFLNITLLYNSFIILDFIISVFEPLLKLIDILFKSQYTFELSLYNNVVGELAGAKPYNESFNSIKDNLENDSIVLFSFNSSKVESSNNFIIFSFEFILYIVNVNIKFDLFSKY